MRHRAGLADLAHDARSAIAYRYLNEGLDVTAHHAHDLYDVLTGARDRGPGHICLGNTVIITARVATRTVRGNNTRYSGKNQ